MNNNSCCLSRRDVQVNGHSLRPLETKLGCRGSEGSCMDTCDSAEQRKRARGILNESGNPARTTAKRNANANAEADVKGSFAIGNELAHNPSLHGAQCALAHCFLFDLFT